MFVSYHGCRQHNRSRCQGYKVPLEVSKLPSGGNHSFRESGIRLFDRRKTIADHFPCRAHSDHGNLSSYAFFVFFLSLPRLSLSVALCPRRLPNLVLSLHVIDLKRGRVSCLMMRYVIMRYTYIFPCHSSHESGFSSAASSIEHRTLTRDLSLFCRVKSRSSKSPFVLCFDHGGPPERTREP